MFKAVNPKVDIQKLEREQLDFWRMSRVFERDSRPCNSVAVYRGSSHASGNSSLAAWDRSLARLA